MRFGFRDYRVWLNAKRMHFGFLVQRVWLNPKRHGSNRNACVAKSKAHAWLIAKGMPVQITRATSCFIHHTPHTPRSEPCTLNPVPCTLNPGPWTLACQCQTRPVRSRSRNGSEGWVFLMSEAPLYIVHEMDLGYCTFGVSVEFWEGWRN